MARIIILDFDGVIADSLSLQIRSVNKFSQQYGYKRISSPKFFRDLGMQEVIEKLSIPKIHLSAVINKVREEASKHYDEISLFKGIRDILVGLSKKFKLIILSSNQESTITRFLEKNNMRNIFSGVYTTEGLFDKHIILDCIMKDFALPKTDFIFIGDEQRDIEAGKKSGIKTAGVAWGYNSKERLMREKPDALFEKLADLLKII